MNIQIFGTKKCFDTKKAERYFKERNIKVQFIDMKEKGMSKGEFSSVLQAVGGIDSLINEDAKDKSTLTLMKYLLDSDREEKLFENQQLIKTPVVRCGKKATVGYVPEIWEKWLSEN
ncbi:MAG: arsenate reductase family protein [Ruminococcus sp.]|nr:arsenate reductase family protein [Ruminococcus sp.]